jgi:hypothetical protein
LDKVRSDVLDSVPPLTPEAQKTAAADREFRLALLQSTDTCKKMLPGCAGGKYDPTSSPRRTETPPRYVTAGMNRNDGPEDSSLAERCLPISPLLANLLPEFAGATGSFRRIVQTPGGVSMFYEVGQGQGWQRNIVMNGSPHLPANIRQWFGDSRGHWEGNTLVIDVTNFSPKTDVFGSRENLHLVERWMRTGPKTLAYEVTIEDLTVWTRRGPLSRSSASRATRTIGFITNRAASKETRDSRVCCMGDGWKTSPLRRAEVPIPQAGTPRRLPRFQTPRFRRTSCSSSALWTVSVRSYVRLRFLS